MKIYITAVIAILIGLLYVTRNVPQAVADPWTPPMEQQTMIQADESNNNCTIYEEKHAIGKNLQLVTKAVCKKTVQH